MDISSPCHASEILIVRIVRRRLTVRSYEALHFTYIDIACCLTVDKCASTLRAPYRGCFVLSDRVDNILFCALCVLLEVDERVEGLVGDGGDEDRDKECEDCVAIKVVLGDIPRDVQSVTA